MSRRRVEFEHRTSIFEGAYRAWSHLGGIDPQELFTSSASELDPLSKPHSTDERVTDINDEASYLVIDAKGNRKCYPYEPLPRSGLAHPFIQAIISPWLGPDAEKDDIQLGLTTLRTWWQHRRKGESHSAKQSLGTEKIIPVVEGYTRHFFNFAHCGVVNDGDQPPRTLANKIKQLEKEGYAFPVRSKTENASLGAELQDFETEMYPDVNYTAESTEQDMERTHGDPNTIPVVYVCENGIQQILMNVTGITCDRCVRIIETVLNGIQGGQSPIQGLLDSVGDRDLSIVLIKVQKCSMAKRIAYEAIQTIKMLGYDGSVKEMSAMDPTTGTNIKQENLCIAYDVAAATDPKTIFDWTMECNCSDHSIVKENCSRHSQLSASIADTFDARAKQVRQLLTGSNGATLCPSPKTQNSQKRKVSRERGTVAQNSSSFSIPPNDTLASEQMMMQSTAPSFTPFHAAPRAPSVTSTTMNTLSMQGGIGLGSLPNQGNFNYSVASNPNVSNLTAQSNIGEQAFVDTNALHAQYLTQQFLTNGNFLSSEGLSIQYPSQNDVGRTMNQASVANTLTILHNINLMNNHPQMNSCGLSMSYPTLNANNLNMHLQMNMQGVRSQMQNQGVYMQYSNPTSVSNALLSQISSFSGNENHNANVNVPNSMNISRNNSNNNNATNQRSNSMQSSNPNSDNDFAKRHGMGS